MYFINNLTINRYCIKILNKLAENKKLSARVVRGLLRILQILNPTDLHTQRPFNEYPKRILQLQQNIHRRQSLNDQQTHSLRPPAIPQQLHSHHTHHISDRKHNGVLPVRRIEQKEHRLRDYRQRAQRKHYVVNEGDQVLVTNLLSVLDATEAVQHIDHAEAYFEQVDQEGREGQRSAVWGGCEERQEGVGSVISEGVREGDREQDPQRAEQQLNGEQQEELALQLQLFQLPVLDEVWWAQALSGLPWESHFINAIIIVQIMKWCVGKQHQQGLLSCY